jgi:hypothetical protein
MHDGLPPRLKALGENRKLAALVEVLFASLRRDPRQRATVTRLRADLRRVTRDLAPLKWPLSAAS